MRYPPILLVAALAVTAPGAVPAEPYVMDKAHAQVTFMVGHLGFSTVQGQFREFEAEIDFDPGRVEATRVSFTVDTASVDTNWPDRDKHLRSRDFFDSGTYPTMTFASTSVLPTGTDTAEITGNLTIRDTTRPVTLQARLNKLGPSPFDPNQTIAGFTVTGEIDRAEFGMGFAAPAVSAIVPIRIDLEMSPAQ